MKSFQLGGSFLLMVFVALLAGCQTRQLGGVEINSIAIQSLERGMSYQDVIGEIGQPLWHVDGERVIAYTWDTSAAHVQMNTIILNTVDDDKSYGDTEILAQFHALCLRFDGQKQLIDWKTISESSHSNRVRAVTRWARVSD